MIRQFVYLLFVLPLWSPALSFGQAASDWGAFAQRLNVEAHEGKRFRLQAAVRVELIDSTAEAEIWVRVDKKDKRAGFFDNMMDKPIRSAEWQVYTIEGTIDLGAEFLAFGGLYSRQGRFYFDDFKLFIESGDGQFGEVPIPMGGFEGDTLSKHWGYMQQHPGFTLTTTGTAPYNGAQAAVVDGSRFRPAPSYGSNDKAGKFVEANGIKLYYEEYGQGEPLLLLHGNSQSIAAFTFQIPDFEKHYRVIAVDTRGQGKSSEDGRRYTYELFAEDMKAFLDQLGLDSVNVLGWSDGGNTGLLLAMKYPHRVKRLVTMGAAIYTGNNAVREEVLREAHKRYEGLASDPSVDSQHAARLMKLLLTEPNRVYEDLHAIRCPVLVMAGENDLIQESHTRGIASHLPNGTLFIAPGENHYFPVNNPQLFNQKVLDFLKP